VVTSGEHQYTFLIISRRFLLRKRNISKTIVQNVDTCILCLITKNRTFYEIMCRNIVEPDWPQMTVRRIRTSCWIAMAKNTHSECVILLLFPLQQWFHKRVSLLRYT